MIYQSSKLAPKLIQRFFEIQDQYLQKYIVDSNNTESQSTIEKVFTETLKDSISKENEYSATIVFNIEKLGFNLDAEELRALLSELNIAPVSWIRASQAREVVPDTSDDTPMQWEFSFNENQALQV